MKILDEVSGASKIAIGGHIRPDGDCLGSCLAMYNYLKKSLPDCETEVFLEKPPAIFSVLKGFDSVRSEIPQGDAFDVFICLDCGIDRLRFSEPLFNKAKKRINIDHHVSNPGCGHVNYIYPEASSTAELVYDVMDRDLLDENIAVALYTGIIHDTGVLKYSNTSPKTLRTVADLISFGFDFTKLVDETFYEKTYVQSQLLGRALVESCVFMDGKCAVAQVSKKYMDFYGALSSDLEGIVNQLLFIKGVECAIFMNEYADKEFKASLRSRNIVDVAVIAQHFGGGGHVRAAGCVLKGTYEECVKALAEEIGKQL